MSLLQLGVRQGDHLRLCAKGSDAQQAIQALQEAIELGLDDEPEMLEAREEIPALQLTAESIVGIAASPGIVIAPLYHYRPRQLVFAQTASDSEAEAHRLQAAIEVARRSLSDLYSTVLTRSGKEQAAIFRAHQELLDDPELITETLAKLPPNHSAAWAWQQVIESRAQTLAALDNPILAGRAADVRDVGQRVLALLADDASSGEPLPEQPVVLVADDLTPSDTAGFDTRFIKGFCTAKGGATSHTAIIARSLNLPAVVGAGAAVLSLPAGKTVVLDGNGGALYPQPTEPDLDQARAQQQQQAAQQDRDYRDRFQPAITTDSHRIEVVANIGKPSEAQQAIEAGAEGVGLLRTEFLFLNRENAPTEAEQFSALSQMTQALNGLPLIVRTLDIGGDKAVPYLEMPAEENPFLGVRGIRLCLARSDLFETQLRAILRAAQGGYIRVMFPMIATLEDIRAGKAVLESVRAALDAPPVEVGMMVEVPSAVLMADAFAQEVDFFSVGTNDLTQYLLAMDRGHPVLAKQADALHPAVLRAIHQTVQAAEAAGKWVGVCGGVASEPLGATLLSGLGVKELSVDIPTVAAVKATLRRRSLTQMQKLAKRALRCRNAEEVRNL
jgi:phosphocarrier protein FPr